MVIVIIYIKCFTPQNYCFFFDIAKFFCIFLQNNANLVAIYLFLVYKKGSAAFFCSQAPPAILSFA
jgi:hypothetical protein